MVLKKWSKVIRSDMGAYYPEKDNETILKFPKELSPLTNFSLDIFSNVISQKNMIINFPDFKLYPASLFAYIFADKFNQSVYILADERGDSLNSRSKFSLNKNHYLLCNYREMLFHFLPVFYLKKLKENEEDYQNNSIEYKLSLEKYLPRAIHSFKKKYTEKNVLNNKFHPKFIIDTDNKLYSIKEKLSQVLKTNDEYLNPKEYPIGFIIIENGDRFFHSFGRLENFVSWFKELDSEVKLLIHFNNPYLDYVKLLVNELDFIVLPLNNYILENNEYLKSISKEYFNNVDSNKFELLNRYNLDSKFLFAKKENISIYNQLISSGSIDTYFGSAYSTFKKIDVDNVYNQYSLHKSRELLFTLYNLTINPSNLKISFKLNKKWIKGSIPHFIQNFKSMLHQENQKNRFFIHSFLDSLSNMYYELTNCKRVGEDLSYSRKAKDYILFELLEKLSKTDENVFIGTYMDTEPIILNEILEKGIGSNNNLFPINMEMLIQKSDSNKEGSILVLPGVLPEVFTSELFKPYKEIIILSYEGNNHRFLQEQLDSLFGNILEEKQYMSYLKDVLDEFDESENNEILNDFNERFKLIEFKGERTDDKIEIMEQDNNGSEENIFSVDLHLNEYMDEWEKSKSNLNVDISNMVDQKNYDTISFKLMNIQDNKFIEKKLPINKSYLTFDNIYNINDAKELKPSELKSGDYIIIIDNDEKKSLLNLVIELSNFNFIINMDLVEYWKLEFLNYVESSNLKYSEIYNIYCSNGGDKTYQTVMQWCKGEILGPQSAKDLYIIGKIINDGFIMDNYISIFQQIVLIRTSHRLIGRKLKKMIKSILTDEYLDVSSLNENEYLIYKNIQNGIYKIV